MSLPLPAPAPAAPHPALAAAVDLLAERGWHGLHLDAVAARSGVPVLQLQADWPSLSHLVAEAVAGLPVVVDRGDTGSTAGDLAAALEHWARPLGRGELAVAAVAEAAGRDGVLRGGVEAAVGDAVDELVCAVSARARARGEALGGARQQWVTAVLGGVVWERITGRGRPVPDARRAELVASVLAA
ncbi:TetR/AcrR family transcriptional regulator C-terminal ligand-binding domain-containing protein [Klenkia brasiliensis]|uniref:Transcriptional regulator, TetR family n=1 Tax=Klenkia brasiliensis TaxID=333142 RepID=A0A1G7VSH8_9ACTN|nr:TetR/AcrR family transcriptional regulator C-terminal ligand-binding domain-containing protein [Klenkia brasiliensis]SDG62379.1 transcriptional regulator, TetR family [Klenkia brasiliensis]